MSVPNQKLILLERNKVDTTQKRRRYLMIYTDNLNTAYSIMGGEKCFGLYLYLLERIPHLYDGQPIPNAPPKFELSQTHVEEEMGMSKSTYARSIEKLISLGFLEPIQGNLYQFYEMPKQYRPRTLDEYNHDEEIKCLSIADANKILKERHDEQLRKQVITEQIGNRPSWLLDNEPWP